MHPQLIEDGFKKLESSLCDFVAKKPALDFIFALLITFYIYLSYNIWSQPLENGNPLLFAQDRFWAIVAIAPFAFLSFYVSSKIQTALLVITVTASWILPLYKMESLTWFAAIPLLFLAVISLLFRISFTSSLARSMRAFMILLLFLVSFWGISKAPQFSGDAKIFMYFVFLHAEILAVIFFLRSLQSRKPQTQQIWNPLQLVGPLPWPESNTVTREEARVLRARGWLEIFRGQLTFMFIVLMFRYIPVYDNWNGRLVSYLGFIFAVSGGMAVISGFQHIFGFAVPPASNFIFFAKSPLEIWQRGSTYMARFLFETLFFPLWKRTRTFAIPTIVVGLVVFFHLFFFHDLVLRSLLVKLSPHLPIAKPQIENYLWQPLIWSGLWLVWILIFEWGLKKTPLRQWVWILIALTHLGSSQILWLSQWLLLALQTSA